MQAGLLQHFADDGGGGVFAGIDRAAGQSPAPVVGPEPGSTSPASLRTMAAAPTVTSRSWQTTARILRMYSGMGMGVTSIAYRSPQSYPTIPAFRWWAQHPFALSWPVDDLTIPPASTSDSRRG
ncbi:MAG: hypothetical protein HND48_25395 [Chloroflexi bacterium]|nr:hypothetical protein [Chloroflexota bacterium]